MNSVSRLVHSTFLTLALCLTCSLSHAEPSIDTIEETLANIAADTNEGRIIGSDGHQAARDWIVSKLASIGVQPAGPIGYVQSFVAPPRDPAEHTAKMLNNIVGILYPEGVTQGAPEVLLSAHYDGISDEWHPAHEGAAGNCAVMPDSLEIGFSDVCNAAADNATGVGAILAVLEDIKSKIKAPVAIAFFDGEEDSTLKSFVNGQEGLIGSGYFAVYPAFDISSLKLHVNLETIGLDVFPGLEDQVFAIGAHSGGSALEQDINSAAGNMSLEIDHAHAGIAQRRTDMNSFMFTQSTWRVPFVVFTNGPGSTYHTNFDQYLPDFNHLKNPINIDKVHNIAKTIAKLSVSVTEKSNHYAFSETRIHNFFGTKIVHIDFSMHSLMIEVLDRVIANLNTNYSPDQIANAELIELRDDLKKDSKNFFLKLFWGPIGIGGLVTKMDSIFEASKFRTARYIRTYGIVL